MDRPSQRPGEQTPESLYLDWLARLGAGEDVELDGVCRDHPAAAETLRDLHRKYAQFEELERNFGLVGSVSERLASRYGSEVDPHVELEGEDEGDFTSKLLGRLSDRAPSSRRYRLKGEVATGGMGAILRVWDEDLRRHLAMKVVLGKGPAPSGETPPVDRRMLARFLEEAQVTGQLDHPGIVPVHELGLDEHGRAYFTMKLVRGRDLKAIFDLARDGKEGWSQVKALGVLLKVCEAMSYAHDKGVIHRDLKPANVMVGRYGEVHVMDWGLARILGRADDKDIRLRAPDSTGLSAVRSDRREHEGETPDSPLFTMDGDVVGTPAYMPPEQAEGDLESLGPRSDVYAVGAMLYHLLAGHMPYVRPGEKASSYAVWRWVKDGPPRSLALEAPDAPAELVAICERAMAREPSARYLDMAALAADLSAFLEGRVVAAYETGAWAEARKWVRRNRALAASLAAAVVLLGGGLAVSLVFKARSDENAESTRLAQLEAEARTADVLSLSAQKDLDDLAAWAERLWPPYPELLPEYERWLAEARVLLDGRPADEERGLKSRPSLAEHQAKLLELVGRSVLETDESALARAREQASYPALEAARAERTWMLRMLEREAWPDLAEVEQALEQESLPGEHGELLALARTSVGPEPEDLEQVPRGWVLATRAVDGADDATLPRALLTLAWAEARLGRLEEALSTAESALVSGTDAALEEDAARLRAEVARWQGEARGAREQDVSALTARITGLEVEVGERQYADPEDRWWHVQLSKLVADLEALRDPENGLMSEALSEPFGWGVRKRFEFARTIGERSVEGPEAKRRWEEAIAAIAASPKHGGLSLSPQMGLLPIGSDPDSGLWEFAHLMSGAAAVRGADERLVLTEETGIVLVLIPGGSFWMGAQSVPGKQNHDPGAGSNEGPVHEVELSAYFLSKYEMTQGQWQRMAGVNPSYYQPPGGLAPSLLHPVEQVSWPQCMQMMGRMGLTLPSEAQWERGARGGSDSPWWTGAERESLRGQVNLADQTARKAGAPWSDINDWPDLEDGSAVHSEVGRYPPNAFGLHEVAGNLWEWCLDGFDSGFYGRSPKMDPLSDPGGAAIRVNRGGSFVNRGGSFNLAASNARSASRITVTPELRGFNLGLRPARRITP